MRQFVTKELCEIQILQPLQIKIIQALSVYYPNFNYLGVSFILAVPCVYAETSRFVSNLAYK